MNRALNFIGLCIIIGASQQQVMEDSYSIWWFLLCIPIGFGAAMMERTAIIKHIEDEKKKTNP